MGLYLRIFHDSFQMKNFNLFNVVRVIGEANF